jgi:hypothetical protein
MAGCSISKGKASLACKNVISGFKAIYMANFDEYDYVTSSTTAGHVLTDLGDLDEVFKFALKNTGNNFTQEIISSDDTGTTSFSQVLTFILTKLNSEMEFQVKMMAWGRPQIFVEMNTGQFFLMGKDNGCQVTGNSAVGGAADSLNGYTLTATASMEKDPIWYLSEDAVTALKALVSNVNVAD